jgi:hypothetical protein
MMEIFDGFGSHLASLEALDYCFQNKILSLKEEADSSHFNQSYDKWVAKQTKGNKGKMSWNALRKQASYKWCH